MNPSPKLTTLHNCAEAGMDYETALGCAGLTDCEGVRIAWAYFNRNYR